MFTKLELNEAQELWKNVYLIRPIKCTQWQQTKQDTSGEMTDKLSNIEEEVSWPQDSGILLSLRRNIAALNVWPSAQLLKLDWEVIQIKISEEIKNLLKVALQAAESRDLHNEAQIGLGR